MESRGMSPLQSPSTQLTDNEEHVARRPLRACDHCYQRKIKCDGMKPQCNWCYHHDMTCTFNREHGRKRKAKKQVAVNMLRESKLMERMERLEQVLANALERRLGQQTFTAESPPLPSVSRIQLVGYTLGHVSLSNGISLFSQEGQRWIESRTGQKDVTFDGVSADGLPWANQRQAWGSFAPYDDQQMREMISLPPQSDLQLYYETYINSPIRRVFPVVVPVLFPAMVRKAYDDDGHLFRQSFPQKAFVFSFLAFASIFEQDIEPPHPVDPSKCALAAQPLMSDILNARASTEGIGAMVMLVIYQFSRGNIQTADVILSLASRFLFTLGAHHYPGEEIDFCRLHLQDIEARIILHHRDLFWICYAIDKEITFRTGRPPAINDTSCDLTFPKDYMKHDLLESSEVPQYPGDLRLSLIKSRAYQNLYSPHALRKSDSDLLKDIRELDDQLEKWRNSLSPEHRPTLSFSPGTRGTSESATLNVHHILLRLEYHHCMAIIHHASSRCKLPDQQNGTIEALSSSMRLAVEASRSLMAYLKFAFPSVVRSLFWIVLFYPLTAFTTIFSDLLEHPLNPSADSDLELLRNTLAMTDRMHDEVPDFLEADRQHIQVVHELGRELHRLALCAVEKARKEQAEQM